MNTDVRLISDGSSTSEKMGTVELCTNGEWTSICDNGWDNNDAAVVCAQLGFSAAGGMSVTCCFYCTNLTYSLTHQLIHSLTHSPTHWSTHPLAHNLEVGWAHTPVTNTVLNTCYRGFQWLFSGETLLLYWTVFLIDFACIFGFFSILHWAIFLTIKLHFITQ